MPHGSEELVDANRHTVRTFVGTVSWREDEGDPRRTPVQIHLVTERRIPLRRAYEDLLIPLRFTDEYDSQLFTGVLLQIDSYLQANPEASCTVYQMTKGSERMRSVNDNEEIPTLFQGANYAGAANRDEVYPGDDRVRTADGLTIQIHTLEVRQKNGGAIIASRVPTVAVWVPSSMTRDWLVQART
jgi:hypothetical protein